METSLGIEKSGSRDFSRPPTDVFVASATPPSFIFHFSFFIGAKRLALANEREKGSAAEEVLVDAIHGGLNGFMQV